jgi:hypothetical protein
MIKDKRVSNRRRVFFQGYIIHPQSKSRIDCIVRDVSETGAKLRFRCPPCITGGLELHIPAKGKIVQTNVIWTDDAEIGVSFDGLAGIFDPPVDNEDLAKRLALLEGEIAKLKQVLAHLQTKTQKTDAA